ncbi:olfactory receptor 14J1-like [Tiliqua scincoides]|uniref:olfactory receptor 14J1-like n=1 Tax=Tiliqua scincoides TaxID=71010 RepID=UPI003462EC69
MDWSKVGAQDRPPKLSNVDMLAGNLKARDAVHLHMNDLMSISDFLLFEFSKFQELRILHFLIYLVLYLVAVTGNLLIISVVAFDHRLHTPMYFFLMNLALQDLGQVSVIIPKSMINSLLNTRHISYAGCVLQVLLFATFAGSDFLLLTVMEYDRYVAICLPLQYETIMNRRACVQMVAGVWITGLLYGALHTGGTLAATFCSDIVNQFFCEVPQLLKLYCSKQYQTEMAAVVISILIVLVCFIFVIATYVQIFTAVLKISSVEGRKKTFSTCVPHLIVFSTLVFTYAIVYLRTSSDTNSYMDVVFTITYSTIPPMLNPVIYSMRNRDIRIALSKLFGVW